MVAHSLVSVAHYSFIRAMIIPLKDPFVGISLAMKEVDRPYLTEDELKTLMEFTSDIDRLVKVRDFFVFSCYTGLAWNNRTN